MEFASKSEVHAPRANTDADILSELEQIVGHQFEDKNLVFKALTHRSTHQGNKSYERLEFLGDRVLALVLSEALFLKFPDADPGELTKRFIPLAKESALAQIARTIGLQSFILAASSIACRPSIQSDVLESLIAVLYLDGGIKTAQKFIHRYWNFAEATPDDRLDNPKAALQEWAQARYLGLPAYEVLERRGPDHAPHFVITAILGGSHKAQGSGSSRRAAEQDAARRLLSVLTDEGSDEVESFPEAGVGGVDLRVTSGRPTVLGIGTVGLDFIAFVDQYPSPDMKVRSDSSPAIGGGGNVGNTLTAISRLGLCGASLVAQVGLDGNGRQVLNELESDEVDVTGVLRCPDISTPFTYILVDKSQDTRTCIHTPMAQELSVGAMEASLRKLDFVPSCLHLDSRQTEAALHAVKHFRAMETNIPLVSIDCEKDRPPHMQDLVNLCDIAFTNENYPLALPFYDHEVEPGIVIGLESAPYRPENIEKVRKILSGMAAMIKYYAHINMVVTSLGANGSILLLKDPILETPVHPVTRFAFKASAGEPPLNGQYCPACPLGETGFDKVVDTTGAGDAFIGGFLSQYLHNNKRSLSDALTAGTLTAAAKILTPGARAGLPRDAQGLAMAKWRKRFCDYFQTET